MLRQGRGRHYWTTATQEHKFYHLTDSESIVRLNLDSMASIFTSLDSKYQMAIIKPTVWQLDGNVSSLNELLQIFLRTSI